MKPTKLVYESWKKTDSLPYETSKEKRVIELLDPIGHKDWAEQSFDCYLCGKGAKSGIPKKKLLPKTFNDHGEAKAVDSDYVCDSCSFMILTNPNRRQAIRWFNYVASDKLVICDRVTLRDFVLNPPNPPFVMCIAISQKKHLFYYLQTSYNRENYFVTMETDTMPVNLSRITEMVVFVERLYNLDITKDQILSNRLPFGKLSVSEWQEAHELINEYQKEKQFALSVYIAQKEEKA